VYEIGVGNLNSLLLAGIVGAWYLLVRRYDIGAGVVIAGMTALKLTPVLLAWWLITQRRWTAVRAFVVAGLVIAVVSLLGAGLTAHLEYLGIVRQTSTAGTSDLSLAGLARSVGVDPGVASVLPAIALVAGFVAIWLLRARPGLAYAVAVVTMLLGSPVVNVNWFTVLLAAMAPVVWPLSPATTSDPTAVDHAGAPADTSEGSAGATTGA
jgi:hypothetical protein